MDVDFWNQFIKSYGTSTLYKHCEARISEPMYKSYRFSIGF